MIAKLFSNFNFQLSIEYARPWRNWQTRRISLALPWWCYSLFSSRKVTDIAMRIIKHYEYSESNRRISNLLFTLSIASIFLFVITTGIIVSIFSIDAFPRCLWVGFFYAILPLSSFIFGYISWRRGFNGKKNMIGGAIIAFLLIGWGISGFINVPLS